MIESTTHESGKSIAIVGGGIAGLCAGCYGQMNGYRVKIFEMHTLPGGVCTAWTRNGYTIDSCIHWLLGSAPGAKYHRLWKEVGALQGRDIINLDEYLRIEGKGGQTLSLYGNVDRLERHLLQLAPEDRRAIRSLTRAVRRFARLELPVDKAPELATWHDKLATFRGILPFLGLFMKWRGATVAGFAKRLRNPFLREAFTSFLDDISDFPMLALIMPLAWQHLKVAGYPAGGSLPFAHAIEKRFLDLGGEIRYAARVSEILVENDRAVGVRLEDGSEHRADTVISAADGHATIFDLLAGRYVNDTIRGYYNSMRLFPPLLYVSLGIADPLKDLPATVSGISFPLDPPVEIDGKLRHRLSMMPYHFDPQLAPDGKAVLIVMLNSDYDRWKKLSEDPQRYREEKTLALERIIDGLEQRLPGLREKIEMRDVATPLTWERYTGNWRGSYEGWMPTGKSMNMRMSKTLPGLSGFYMTGQWVNPGGGLPPAVSSGRHVIQLICRHDGKRFVATQP
jgi:phytoene dehydrogenase-like protein